MLRTQDMNSACLRVLLASVMFISVSIMAAAQSTTENTSAGKLYKQNRGPHTVGVVRTLGLTKKGRPEPLEVRVTYPKLAGDDAGEPFPVIVFSHGALGSKDGYRPLAEHWASHGYVCVQPTHGDSLSKLTLREKLKIGSLKEHLAKVTSVEHWRTRPEDVRLVLDSLDKIESKVDGLKGRIDKKRIGVAGHSFGAHTSMLIAGMRLKHPVTKKRVGFSDERPKAFVWISPQGTGKVNDAESWKLIKRPVLVITGTKDTSPRNGKGHKWRREAYDHMPRGAKKFLLIKDAHHGFGGIVGRVRFPGSGPNREDHVDLVRAASLAMWDAHLKKDAKAAAFLSDKSFNKAASNGATLESK